MNTYGEWTREIGDQWVAALKRVEEAITSAAANVKDAAAKVNLPPVQVPEQVGKFNEAMAERLPKPQQVVEANFELTTRLLAAHRELTLKLLDASAPGTSEPTGAESA